jgi:sulfur relay (sulfurtransferase) DsrF/TusC family protein
MSSGSSSSLALIIQRAPYRDRVARADIDIALAAAALDFQIRIYFLGLSVLQVAERDIDPEAMLPKGYRAWTSLPDLADTRVFAERRWLDFCQAGGIELLMPVEALEETEMRRSWRSCKHVLAL